MTWRSPPQVAVATRSWAQSVLFVAPAAAERHINHHWCTCCGLVANFRPVPAPCARTRRARAGGVCGPPSGCAAPRVVAARISQANTCIPSLQCEAHHIRVCQWSPCPAREPVLTQVVPGVWRHPHRAIARVCARPRHPRPEGVRPTRAARTREPVRHLTSGRACVRVRRRRVSAARRCCCA